MSPGTLHTDLERLRDEFGGVFTVFLPKPVVVLADYESIREAQLLKGARSLVTHCLRYVYSR